jgi:glycosyltransferase involved in cell wall biosynthesis
LKISYIHGLCVRNDAISNAIRDEITWLSSVSHNDVRLYAYECNHSYLAFSKVSDLRDVIFDSHFQSSSLVIFHFGIYYPLFDLLPVVPKIAKCLVVFHNITPKAFVPVENYATIDKSFRQLANIMFADHVVCVSQTNLDVLRSIGINTPATVLPLAVHSNLLIPNNKPSQLDSIIRVSFIGRFVRSKGPGELLKALDKVLQCNISARMTLDMVGNLSFSDSALLDEIRQSVKVIHLKYRNRIKVCIHGDADDELKYNILRDSDVFVLPTYHEGFCVPILEAFASGCKVIAYDNSNIPAICGGLATLIPTGDVAALSRALSEAIEEVVSPAWRGYSTESYSGYSKKARMHIQKYSPERTKRRFLHFIKRFEI